MKYFLIKADTGYLTAPNIINWFGILEKKYINKELHHKIKDRLILTISPNENTIFTDLVTSPTFMVTDKLKEVLKLYDPTMIFKEIILLDYKNGASQLYHLPILDKLECVSEKSLLLPNRHGIEKIVLDLEKVGNHPLFMIKGGINDCYIIRLDMAESFLRRGAKGISLVDVECI